MAAVWEMALPLWSRTGGAKAGDVGPSLPGSDEDRKGVMAAYPSSSTGSVYLVSVASR